MKVEVQTGNREVIDFEDIDHVNCRIVAHPKTDTLLIRVGELGDCHSTYIDKTTIRALKPHLDKWLETGNLRVEEPAPQDALTTHRGFVPDGNEPPLRVEDKELDACPTYGSTDADAGTVGWFRRLVLEVISEEKKVDADRLWKRLAALEDFRTKAEPLLDYLKTIQQIAAGEELPGAGREEGQDEYDC